jgi:hypothetical protein
MSKQGSKYDTFLEDPSVKRWHTNLARGSPITARVSLRRLSRLCELLNTTPHAMVDLARNDLSGFQERAR